jgi:hypothetical protein
MERAKVRVMVSFFGRETPVELDFLTGREGVNLRTPPMLVLASLRLAGC